MVKKKLHKHIENRKKAEKQKSETKSKKKK